MTIKTVKKHDDMEIRKFAFKIRAENSETYGDYITGRPILYNSVTSLGGFDEVIETGALKDSDLKDVRFLVNHNIDMIPLARSRNNNENSTMQMSVNESGMNIRVNLDTENNSEARNLYSAIKRGDIDGMSFMFTIDDDEWIDQKSDHPLHRIKRIGKVFEVSAVTFPAYEETTISARSKAALDSVRSQLLDSSEETELEGLKLKIQIKTKGML